MAHKLKATVTKMALKQAIERIRNNSLLTTLQAAREQIHHCRTRRLLSVAHIR